MRVGRADYLWVNPKTGSVIAYLNTGHGIAQSWAPVNDGKYIASGAGGTGDGVFFADLNGDRRADYIYVYKSGKIVWWRNDGPSKRGWNWHGPVALNVGGNRATQKNVIFGDINGDGMCSCPLSPLPFFTSLSLKLCLSSDSAFFFSNYIPIVQRCCANHKSRKLQDETIFLSKMPKEVSKHG